MLFVKISKILMINDTRDQMEQICKHKHTHALFASIIELVILETKWNRFANISTHMLYLQALLNW